LLNIIHWLIRKLNNQWMNFICLFSLQVKFSFRVFFFFFFSCLIEEKGLSLISYLSLITHGNEQQQWREEKKRKKKFFQATYTFFFFLNHRDLQEQLSLASHIDYISLLFLSCEWMNEWILINYYDRMHFFF